MGGDDRKPEEVDGIPRLRKEPRPDLSASPAAKQLPKALQDKLDDEDSWWSSINQGSADRSTDSNVRYAAYASRIRTILLSAQRYVAYTSDIGESFRPVAHPYLIKGAYAVSWAYLAGDVSFEGYKAYQRNQRVLNPQLYASKEANGNATAAGSASSGSDASTTAALAAQGTQQQLQLQPGKVPAIEDYRAVMVQRGLFQGLASMGLPAFTIHSIVRYSGRAMKEVKNQRIRSWGPIGLGLAAVPFLPYVFDKPVEEAIEWTFHKSFEAIGGPEAVGRRPATGREELMTVEAKATAPKEKEL